MNTPRPFYPSPFARDTIERKKAETLDELCNASNVGALRVKIRNLEQRLEHRERLIADQIETLNFVNKYLKQTRQRDKFALAIAESQCKDDADPRVN